MLYEFLVPLREWFIGFNLLRYQSFRAAMAALTAFLICLWWGPKLIRALLARKLQERPDKTDAPELQQIWQGTEKSKTPTMGGVLLAGCLLVSVLLWGRLTNLYVLLAIAVFLGFGLVGFADDFIKLKDPKKSGLSRTGKMVWLSTIGLLVLLALYNYWQTKLLKAGEEPLLRVYAPLFKGAFLDLAAWGIWGAFAFFAFEWLVLVGCSNAVNITDGMDGLAAGCSLMVALAMAALCYVMGRVDYTSYLHLPYVEGCGELSIFAAALAGACLGFLWFNCYPAQIFLGDTGALAIGGSLGFLAIVSKQEFMLPVVGGIFFLEALSSYIQIMSFKRWKFRPFRIAPIHHVFQLDKVPEPKIVVRFWIIGAILALCSVAALKLR